MSEENKPNAVQRWLVPNNWRPMLVWSLIAGLVAYFINPTLIDRGGTPLPVPPVPAPVWQTGWVGITDEERHEALAVFGSFEDTPAGKAKLDDLAKGDVPLWRIAAAARGEQRYPTRDQGPVGTCVSFGGAAAVEVRLGVQHWLGKRSDPGGEIASEVLYAGSRVEANGGRCPIPGQDGSLGEWLAVWLSKGGALKRKAYENHDLTKYDTRRAKKWGDEGVPDELEPLARENVISSVLVRTAADAEKALRQGYPIFVCSNQGFGSLSGKSKRDAEGFLRPQGQWSHCMAIIGYREDRPGFLILNSWGEDWIEGPLGKHGDIPLGSFWAETAVVHRMLMQGDSYAVSDVGGFPKTRIDPADWIVSAPRRPRPPKGRPEPLFPLAP